DGLRYSKAPGGSWSHGNRATAGLTRCAGAQLGGITKVELPKEGEKMRAGEPFGTVESVKAVSDLFAPLTGTVVKVNDPLSDSPEYVNDDCYDEGWMVQIELSNPAEVQALLSAEQYAEFLKEQEQA